MRVDDGLPQFNKYQDAFNFYESVTNDRRLSFLQRHHLEDLLYKEDAQGKR
jgi:hypothetical protein